MKIVWYPVSADDTRLAAAGVRRVSVASLDPWMLVAGFVGSVTAVGRWEARVYYLPSMIRSGGHPIEQEAAESDEDAMRRAETMFARMMKPVVDSVARDSACAAILCAREGVRSIARQLPLQGIDADAQSSACLSMEQYLFRMYHSDTTEPFHGR